MSNQVIRFSDYVNHTNFFDLLDVDVKKEVIKKIGLQNCLNFIRLIGIEIDRFSNSNNKFILSGRKILDWNRFSNLDHFYQEIMFFDKNNQVLEIKHNGTTYIVEPVESSIDLSSNEKVNIDFIIYQKL